MPKKSKKPRLLSFSWIGLTLFSIPLISITLFQLNVQPIIIINVNLIEGLDKTRSINPFSVLNAKGEEVRFSIWTLTADYSWAPGFDGTDVEGKPVRLNETYETLPLSKQQIDGLNSAEEIICIGASSQEFKIGSDNTKEARQIEEARAGRRAASIVRWIRPELNVRQTEPDSFVVRLLKNLGVMRLIEYFAGTPPALPKRKPRAVNIGQWENPQNKSLKETEDQRRVIVILVLRNEKGEYFPADDVALAKAFEVEAANGQRIYNYILNDYSKTKNRTFAWE